MPPVLVQKIEQLRTVGAPVWAILEEYTNCDQLVGDYLKYCNTYKIKVCKFIEWIQVFVQKKNQKVPPSIFRCDNSIWCEPLIEIPISVIENTTHQQSTSKPYTVFEKPCVWRAKLSWRSSTCWLQVTLMHISVPIVFIESIPLSLWISPLRAHMGTKNQILNGKMFYEVYKRIIH